MTLSLSSDEFENTLQVLSTKIPTMDANQILLGRLTRLLNCKISTKLNVCLRHYHLTDSLWYALLAVYSQPNQEILPSRLGIVLNLTRTSATRLSDELVEKGWVLRYIHPNDRRKIKLQLTEKGVEIIQKVSPETNAVRHEVWSKLNTTEQLEMLQLIKKLIAE